MQRQDDRNQPPRGLPKPPALPKPAEERSMPTPGKRAGPPPLPPASRKTDYLEIDVSIEIPEAAMPPPLRVQDAALEANIAKLFRHLISKDAVLGAVFTDLTPYVDAKQNVLISGKAVGKLFIEEGRPRARIYLDRIWPHADMAEKVRMFTNSIAFVLSSASKCKFLVVDEKSFKLAYANSEDGPAIMQI
ncbi:hypothetical protein H0O02_05015 [Candidatus Micrarchaeota archaeon]|nr:hypothetical protein [Candidatus Micrarchaeota archaeon]